MPSNLSASPPPPELEPDASGFSLIGHSASEVHLDSLVPHPLRQGSTSRLVRLDPDEDYYEEDEEDEDEDDSGDGEEAALVSRTGTRRRARRSESWSSTDRAVREPESAEGKWGRGESYLVYGVFVVLGASTLLAWNTEIVAGRYFRARLEGTAFEATIESFVATAFTVSNLGFLYLANVTQSGADLTRRIQVSMLIIASILGLYIYSTTVAQINTTLFFLALMTGTVVLSGAASFLQNAVVALSSHFGPFYFQGLLSGQGAVGVAVAAVQLASAFTANPSLPPPLEDQTPPFISLPQRVFDPESLAAPTPDAGVLKSTFTFFLAVSIFSAFALISHALLLRLPLYKCVLRLAHLPTHSSPASPSEAKSRRPSVAAAERKVRKLGLTVFWLFTITLSMFPSITASVLSVHDPEKGGTGELGARFSEPGVFVAVGFLVFALGDLAGRVVSGFRAFTFTDWRWLAVASAARTVFIPLFLMCNVQAGRLDVSPIIHSDIAFLFLMFVFAMSNGYIASLIFLAAVVEPSLEEDEIDIAATCLVFYLTAGLVAGSFISFPVRAAICGCSPF